MKGREEKTGEETEKNTVEERKRQEGRRGEPGDKKGNRGEILEGKLEGRRRDRERQERGQEGR